jgi:hypothetical protein
LVNSVHLSTYSLSGHDAPKAAASIQDAITGCLRSNARSRSRVAPANQTVRSIAASTT